MKHFLFTIILCFWFVSLSSPIWGFPYPVAEPDIHTCISWDITHSGLLIVGYDLDGSKKPDYFTLRIIISAFFSPDSKESVAKNFPGKHVFFIDYEKDSMFYIGASHPIFYAYDFDEDGHFDLLFKDKLEDGINGNEEYYDSPSKYYDGLPKEVS